MAAAICPYSQREATDSIFLTDLLTTQQREPIMGKLKSGLRFNASMREALAIAIATARTGSVSDDVKSLYDEVTSDIIGAYWKASELNESFKTFNPQNYTNGEFPVVSVLNIKADGVRHTINIEPTALPFSVYLDQYEAYDNLVEDLTKDMAAEFVEKNAKHQVAFNTVKVKIEEFIKPFTSPAKLIEVAPDFAEHFPSYYYDDTESEATTSLDELLAA